MIQIYLRKADTTMDIHEISDKLEIADLLTTYARAVDTRDWALWRSVFTDDAHVDYSSTPYGRAGSRDEIAEWLGANFEFISVSMHYVTNIESRVDGDTAQVRAMFYNPIQLPGTEGLSFCGGYYHHTMVRTETGWRSSGLVEENVWFVNNPLDGTESAHPVEM